jgi:hypothetical protein
VRSIAVRLKIPRTALEQGPAAWCQHHAYELALTAVELRTWHTEVSELSNLLASLAHRQQRRTGCGTVGR